MPVEKDRFLLPAPKQAAPLGNLELQGEPGGAGPSGDLCAIKELSRFIWAAAFPALKKETLARQCDLAREARESCSILLGKNCHKKYFKRKRVLQSSALLGNVKLSDTGLKET